MDVIVVDNAHYGHCKYCGLVCQWYLTVDFPLAVMSAVSGLEGEISGFGTGKYTHPCIRTLVFLLPWLRDGKNTSDYLGFERVFILLGDVDVI